MRVACNPTWKNGILIPPPEEEQEYLHTGVPVQVVRAK